MVVDSCEHSNELSGSIKFWEVLEWLHNWGASQEGLSSMELVFLNFNNTKQSTTLFHCNKDKRLQQKAQFALKKIDSDLVNSHHVI
jgi:hypothetical protein